MLQWKHLDIVTPCTGTLCVVGHFEQGNRKPTFGLWEYRYSINQSYWQTKYGDKIPCNKYDHWCDVDDIISVVGERVEDEFRAALEELQSKL